MYAAACPKSPLVSPFAINYCSLYHCHSSDLSFFLFPRTVPNIHVLLGLCAFSHPDNLSVYLFLIQHFCFYAIPFRPQCFDLISSHVAILQHSSGVLQSSLQFWLCPCSGEEQWDEPIGWGLLHKSEKEVEKSQLSSGWCQCANKPPRIKRCIQKRVKP